MMFKKFLKDIFIKYLYSSNILQAPRVCKNNHVMCCDWLPEWAEWSYPARSGLPAVSSKRACSCHHGYKSIFDQACVVWSRWLDIGLVLFFAFYKHAINMSSASRCKSTELGQYPTILTSRIDWRVGREHPRTKFITVRD